MSHFTEYEITPYIYQIFLQFFQIVPNFCLNQMNFRGGFEVFLKENCPKMGCSPKNWQSSKLICLNCKEGGEGSTKIQNVSIKDVSIMLKGGTGKAN